MKTAIVTGGSRGIGEAMVCRLGELGYNVVINYNSDSSKALCDNISEKLKCDCKVNVALVQADVSTYEGCKKIVDHAVETFGARVDLLINNAGVTNNKAFHEMDHKDYEWLMNINLMSNLHMSRLVLPYMVEQKSGNIINISSVGGLMGVAYQGDYCASKSGVIGLTRALAMEYGKFGIRVNSIAPGMIWTDMLRGVDQDQVNALKQSIPMGEIGDVEEIASTMEYLIKSTYMTGQTVSPNGGIVMQ